MKTLMTTALSCLAAAALSARADFTAASYEQNGLVGLWDAEENAGLGTHEDAPTKWKNLVDASVAGRVPDFIVCSGGTFEAKAFAKTSANFMATNEYVVTDGADGHYFPTVEVVLSGMPSTGSAVALWGSQDLQIVVRDDYGTDKKRCIYTSCWTSSCLETDNKPEVASISALFKTAYSSYFKRYRISGVSERTYQGGDNATKLNEGIGGSITNNLSIGGICGSYSYLATTGYKIHSIRLYNRQLTAAERQANMLVDHMRFGAAVYKIADADKLWTGAAGDGKFTTHGNWADGVGIIPGCDYGKTMKIHLQAHGEETISNDVGVVTAATLRVSQATDATKSVTVKGQPFVLTTNTTRWHSSDKAKYALYAQCPMTFDPDLTFAGSDYSEANFYGETFFNGNIVVKASERCWFVNMLGGVYGNPVQTTIKGSVTALGKLFAPNGDNSDFHFYGPVTGQDVNPEGPINYLHYHATGNSWTTTVPMYGGIVAGTANALPSDLVFTWVYPAGANYSDDGTHCYKLRADQTCDRIQSNPVIGKKGGTGDAFMRWRNRIHSDTQDVTLTLKGTADATSYGALVSDNGKKLNLVWDPTGDYTQTIGGLAHTMIGEIVVKGGTFASAGTNTFQYVTALRIADGAKFAVTSCDYGVATNPFTGTTDLLISGTGKVSVPAGVTVTVNTAYMDGVPMPARTYTAADGWVKGEGSVQVANCDGTGWKSAATSGNWNDAANWTDGVPSGNKKAYLTAEGANYTVTMADGAAWPKDLLIRGANATLKVTGTDIAYDGDGKTSSIAVEDGGTLLVDGGSVVITNFTGTFTVGSTVATSSRVEVASGLFSYAPKSYGSPMTFKTGGLADVTGGELRIIEVYQLWSGNPKREPFLLDGGNMSISGDGNLNFVYKSELFLRMPGEMRFTGNARMATLPSWRDVGQNKGKDKTLNVMPDEGETLTLTFEDHASLALDGAFCLGNKYGSGRAIVNFFSDAQQYMPYNVFVGNICGYGELNITNGVFQGKNGMPRGLAVGISSQNSEYGFEATEGVFNLSGGSVTICRDGITGWGQNSRILGFDIGYGQQAGVTEGGPYVGTANISGGALTNNQGNTVIGMGLARGTLNVSGGTYYTYNTSRAHFVGLAGGTGTVVQAGGEIAFGGDVYLGGAWTNATYQGSKLVANGWDVTRHDAAGTIVHSNGTFVAGKNLVLGADGVGTVDIVGTEGTFTVGGDLVFSNTTQNAQSGGTLNFTFGAAGVKPVEVAGKAVFRGNAKMTVDLGIYAGTRSLWLIKAKGGIVETSAPTITLTGATGPLARAEVRKSANGYRLVVPRGLQVIFY